MKIFDDFCGFLSVKTFISKGIISSILLTVLVFVSFYLVKVITTKVIKKLKSGREEYFLNQSIKVLLNVIEVLFLLLVWGEYVKDLMTLISIISAAITIVLRELILNFFSGLYIKIKKPFKVEDRIQIEDIKGDVMNISSLNFEILEVSSKEENGQSTGIVVSFPNSVVFSKPVKNINKGFKYIWSEITVNVRLDCDLVSNKQEIYKIVNSLETIKNIPKKMKNQVNEINTENRIYFNKYEPIIYTKIVENHVELTVRYLMHPKKSRYVESVIWNKIFLGYRDGKINLYTN